eukprot:GFUD01097054.1.p1 GENE.GFUD01097054.1~~GFUD01097054.1.p1  ORF type:complete len:148 (+),score=21.73 GFUD01097054.1:72-515(+)
MRWRPPCTRGWGTWRTGSRGEILRNHTRFRSTLPVVSNLTAMNMWDGVNMFFIYASFIEFILVNYLARWVQDPEQQTKKRENAILDSLMIVTHTMDVKQHEMEATLHKGMGNMENRLKGGDPKKSYEVPVYAPRCVQLDCDEHVGWR